MDLEKKSESSTSLNQSLDDIIEELSDIDDTIETTPIKKAPLKGKDLQKQRLENATQVFGDSVILDSNSMSEIEFLFRKFLQDESKIDMNPDMKMSLDEAEMIVEDRLSEIGFSLSPDQKKTPADGKLLLNITNLLPY